MMQVSQEEFVARYRDLPTTTDVLKVVDLGMRGARERLREDLFSYGVAMVRPGRPTPEHRGADGVSELVIKMAELGAQFAAQPEDELRDRWCNAGGNFQGGWLPPGTEIARDHRAFVERLAESEQPFYVGSSPTANPYSRFLHGVGARRSSTQFPALLTPTLRRAETAEWQKLMDDFGGHATRVAREVFKAVLPARPSVGSAEELLAYGTHVVAPTFTDLMVNDVGAYTAKIHFDIGGVSVHRASRAVFTDTWESRPLGGLIVLTSEGRALRVVTPPDAWLVQAAQQMAVMCPGIHNGMHWVVVPPERDALVEEARDRGCELWRISATEFAHIDPDREIWAMNDDGTPREGEGDVREFAGAYDMRELFAIMPGDIVAG